MSNLIDKAALVAEIERLRALLPDAKDCNYLQLEFARGQQDAFTDFEEFVNSLEVKEVDLEKEIKNYFNNQPIITRSKGVDYQLIPSGEEIAKHFFELGVNASNPLTWEDIKTIQDKSGEVYAEVAKGKDDFYSIYPTEQSFLEEVLKRFKAQKGE